MAGQEFSSLSKEELIALLEKTVAENEQAELAHKKEVAQIERQQSKTILNLRQQCTQLQDENAVLIEDNRKLKIHRENTETVILEVVRYIKETRPRVLKIFSDRELESLLDLSSFQTFCLNLIRNLISSTNALIYHQERSLNLGTSEKNSPKNSQTDDEKELEEYGREEITAQDSCDIKYQEHDNDLQDFEDAAAQEFTAESPTDRSQLSSAAANGHPALALLKDRTLKSPRQALDRSFDLIKDCSYGKYRNEGVIKRRESYYVSTKDSSQVAGIVTCGSKHTVRAYCHCCGEAHEFSLQKKVERFNRILTRINSSGDIGTMLSPVYNAVCPICGTTVEIGPAMFESPELIKSPESITLPQTENVPSTDYKLTEDRQSTDTEQALKTALQSAFCSSDHSRCNDGHTPEQTAADSQQSAALSSRKVKAQQRQRKAVYKEIARASDSIRTNANTDALITINGNTVIDPWSFNADAFSASPAFAKSCLSTGMLAAAGSLFSQIGAPKNRQFNFFQGQGFPLSREQLTGAINCFARAYLKPVADLIRKDILKNSSSILMDESTILVTSTARRNTLEGRSRKSQIFSLCSGWSSPINAAWFHVACGRGAEHIADILKDGMTDAQMPQFLTVDGYRGYDRAIRELKDSFGISMKLTRCCCHLRRPVHRWLKANSLLEIYNKYLLPAGSLFSDFADNLKAYMRKPKSFALTSKEHDMLIIYYLINSLFVVDAGIVQKHRYNCQSREFLQELREARRTRTAKLIDMLYDAVRLFIDKYPECMTVRVKDNGTVSYQSSRMYPEGKAIIYLLRYEEDVRRITLSPEIELTQSKCERSLKSAIYLRKNCEYLKSEDGAAAFANYETIAHTCSLCGVPVYSYTVWLVANMRRRMLKLQNEGHGDPTFFRMPQRIKKIEEQSVDGRLVETRRTLGIYDPENKTGYDKVDVSGLAPYDYRKYLDSLNSSK